MTSPDPRAALADELQAMVEFVHCAVCGQPCIFVSASGDPDEAPSKFGGWYCSPCDAYTETDVEVED